MSSYLNIYLVKKESSKDSPLLFISFSRNHPIYRAVVEAIAPVWVGNEDIYTELTYDNLTECINSLDEETNHIVNLFLYQKLQKYQTIGFTDSSLLQDQRILNN